MIFKKMTAGFEINLLLLLFCYFFSHSGLAFGSTFIGNGGDQADFLLRMDLQDFKRTLQSIDSNNSERLCTCSPNNPFILCQGLSSLSQEERAFCQQTILKSREQLLKVLASVDGSASSKNLKIELRPGPLSVKTRNGQVRRADAVASMEDNSIYIDRDRFLELGAGARLALLVHEFFHLVKDTQGKYWADEGGAGPFKGMWGSRDALDSFGAALAVFHWEVGLDLDRSVDDLSKGWTKNALSLGWVSLSGDTSGQARLLMKNGSDGFCLGYGHYFRRFGLDARWTSLKNGKSKIAGLNPSLESDQYSLAASKRIFPFFYVSNRFSQFHLQFLLGASFVTSRWKISDSESRLSSHARGFSPLLSAEGVFPILYDFWLYIGISGEYLSLKHRSESADLSGFYYSSAGGLRYGF